MIFSFKKKEKQSCSQIEGPRGLCPSDAREFTALIFLCVGWRLKVSACPEERWESFISVVPWSCTQVGTW